MSEGEPTTDSRSCPNCGQLSSPSASWCEACGQDLAADPKPICVSCGAAEVETDGYCHSCGHRQPEPRDHVEVSEEGLAAVSDRGQRHHHNEDAVAVARVGTETAILVVCDGVSSTPGSAQVSAVAATATANALADSLDADSNPAGSAVADEALYAAVEAAQAAAFEDTTGTEIDELNPPSTTLVVAVARVLGDKVAVSVAWLGDSRAYWIDGEHAELLTTDHEIDGALTRWIGIDAAHHLPQTGHYEFALSDTADLVVCSDGMWRYFASELGEPVNELMGRLKAAGLAGLDLVGAMVEYANDQGGHDNISVAHWAPGSQHEASATTVETPSGGPPSTEPPSDGSPAADPPTDPTADDPPKEPMQ